MVCIHISGVCMQEECAWNLTATVSTVGPGTVLQLGRPSVSVCAGHTAVCKAAGCSLGSQQCQRCEAVWPAGQPGSQQKSWHSKREVSFPEVWHKDSWRGSTFWKMVVLYRLGKAKKKKKKGERENGFHGWGKRGLETEHSEKVRSQGSVRRRKRKHHENSGLSGGSEQMVNWWYKRSRSLEGSMRCTTARRQNGSLYTKTMLLSHFLFSFALSGIHCHHFAPFSGMFLCYVFFWVGGIGEMHSYQAPGTGDFYRRIMLFCLTGFISLNSHFLLPSLIDPGHYLAPFFFLMHLKKWFVVRFCAHQKPSQHLSWLSTLHFIVELLGIYVTFCCPHFETISSFLQGLFIFLIILIALLCSCSGFCLSRSCSQQQGAQPPLFMAVFHLLCSSGNISCSAVRWGFHEGLDLCILFTTEHLPPELFSHSPWCHWFLLWLCLWAAPQRLLRGCWDAVGFDTWQCGQLTSHSLTARPVHGRALLLHAVLCCPILVQRSLHEMGSCPHCAAGTLQPCLAVPEEGPFCEVGQTSFTASVTSHDNPHLFSCTGTFIPAVDSSGVP